MIKQNISYTGFSYVLLVFLVRELSSLWLNDLLLQILKKGSEKKKDIVI